MKKPLAYLLLVPFLLISCGKAEELKTIEIPTVVQTPMVATGVTVDTATGSQTSTISYSETFIVKDNAVYWIDNWNNLHEEIKIEGVDVPTFTILDPGYGGEYAKDKSHVYLVTSKYRVAGLNILEYADPASFEILEGRYSKDKGNVYYWGINIKWADPKTFTVSDHGSFGKDKNRVFVWFTPIEGADPETFEKLDEVTFQDINYTYKNVSQGPELEISRTARKVNSQWGTPTDIQFTFDVVGSGSVVGYKYGKWLATDRQKVYLKNFQEDSYEPIIGDPKTFTWIDDIFWKDASGVYCRNGKISKAPSKKLVELPGGSGYFGPYQTDGDRIYYSCTINDFPPTKFKVLGNSGDGTTVFWKTDSGVYANGTLIQKLDPKTFVLLGTTNFAKDHSHVYILPNMIENVELMVVWNVNPDTVSLNQRGELTDWKNTYWVDRESGVTVTDAEWNRKEVGLEDL